MINTFPIIVAFLCNHSTGSCASPELLGTHAGNWSAWNMIGHLSVMFQPKAYNIMCLWFQQYELLVGRLQNSRWQTKCHETYVPYDWLHHYWSFLWWLAFHLLSWLLWVARLNSDLSVQLWQQPAPEEWNPAEKTFRFNKLFTYFVKKLTQILGLPRNEMRVI